MRIILTLVFMFCIGCANAHYREYDENERLVKEISYSVLGKRDLNSLDVDIEKGKIKLGSSRGDAGDLAEAFLNLSEVAKKAAAVP